jgi:hypothetical protein
MNKLFLLLCVLFVSGCINNSENVVAEPKSDVSFSDEVRPILVEYRCISCHSNGSLNFSSYKNLLNSTGSQYGTDIVTPEDANASGLVDKIEANPRFGARMPTGGPFLSGNEIETIRAWINEGALNN